MTPHTPETSTSGTAVNTAAATAEAGAAAHITVEGFDSLVPEVIDLDAPRDGVPLVIETPAGLERCAAAGLSVGSLAAVPARPGTGGP